MNRRFCVILALLLLRVGYHDFSFAFINSDRESLFGTQTLTVPAIAAFRPLENQRALKSALIREISSLELPKKVRMEGKISGEHWLPRRIVIDVFEGRWVIETKQAPVDESLIHRIMEGDLTVLYDAAAMGFITPHAIIRSCEKALTEEMLRRILSHPTSLVDWIPSRGDRQRRTSAA